MTTVHRTVCFCNHLTWFGAGIFVQPNTLEISKEIVKIKNLAHYPALLATMCSICALYLIAMIWARHCDKEDVIGVRCYRDRT